MNLEHKRQNWRRSKKMSFLSRDRKVKQFAKAVEERDNTIFVFGSDFQTQQFIEDVIRLGLGNKVALIAEDEKNWIDEVQNQGNISVLIEKNLEKYSDKKLYNLIGFNTAEKNHYSPFRWKINSEYH